VGIGGSSGSDVWAVGAQGGTPLVEHWDGTAWTIEPSAVVNGVLSAVAATSTTDAWAVGLGDKTYARHPLVEHWNGTSWQMVRTPRLGEYGWFTSVAAISASDVWAAGQQDTVFGRQTLFEHWDGTRWSVVPSPNPGLGLNIVGALAAISPEDVWVVGTYGNGRTANMTMALHWDGADWTQIPSPNQTGHQSILAGAAALSGDNVWATGSYRVGHRYRTLSEHWDGSAWTLVRSPNVDKSTSSNYLGGAATTEGEVWAVGEYASTTGNQTLVERICPT
jgi:hypothetical protein